MTGAVVLDAELVVLDDRGVEHLRNPLGGRRCLGCREVFPCPTVVGGQQLELGLVTA